MAERILAVDDEELVLELIRRSLDKADYELYFASDGPTALQLFQENKPHLVILDLMMPGMSGWEVCEKLREISTAPIVMLTALTGQDDIIKGLDLGADDYVVKPFQGKELLARVQAVLRRTRMPPPDESLPMRFGNGALIIDPSSRQVRAHGESVDLTPIEYSLLLYMARSDGTPISTTDIFTNVWAKRSAKKTKVSHDNVKWYIWRLRNKIEKDPREPRFILTERGVGYRFALT